MATEIFAAVLAQIVASPDDKVAAYVYKVTVVAAEVAVAVV